MDTAKNGVLKYRCSRCGQVLGIGTHVGNLEGILNRLLDEDNFYVTGAIIHRSIVHRCEDGAGLGIAHCIGGVYEPVEE